jgi:hypothetical protein
MSWLRLHVVLLLIAAVGIGGWAFLQALRPENLVDLIHLFSMC